jgi:hypothetical protein
LLQSGLVLAGAWTRGIEGAVAAMALSAFLTVLVTRWSVIRAWRSFACGSPGGMPRANGGVLLDSACRPFCREFRWAVVWGCSAMLANQPRGYAELGVYNAANQWQQAIQFLPG